MNLKEILYILVVLHTYDEGYELKKIELNSMMIHSLNKIDKSIKNKNQLIQRLKDIIKTNIENDVDLINQVIVLNIDDLNYTNSYSSKTNLKFILTNRNHEILIDVFKNEKKTLTINV